MAGAPMLGFDKAGQLGLKYHLVEASLRVYSYNTISQSLIGENCPYFKEDINCIRVSRI